MEINLFTSAGSCEDISFYFKIKTHFARTCRQVNRNLPNSYFATRLITFSPCILQRNLAICIAKHTAVLLITSNHVTYF